MRKRSITHVAKTVFWYALYFLPVLAYLIFLFTNPLPEEGPEAITTKEDYKTVQNITLNPSASMSSSGYSNFFEDGNLFYPFYLRLNTKPAPENAIDSWDSYVYIPVFAVLPGVEDLAIYSQINDWPIMRLDPTTYKLTDSFTFSLPAGLEKNGNAADVYYYDINSFSLKSAGVLYNVFITPTQYSSSFTYESSTVTDVSYDFSFEAFVESMGFEFATENFIVTTLEDMFGAQGVMPLFNDTAPFIIFGWYICVFIVHLMVDFLMFIPKFAHKWMEDFVGD